MVKIGQTVEYISTRGLSKVALVVATPETLREGTRLSEAFPLDAEQGQVNLVVFRADGGSGPRLQVPYEEAVKDNADFSEGGFYRLIG